MSSWNTSEVDDVIYFKSGNESVQIIFTEVKGGKLLGSFERGGGIRRQAGSTPLLMMGRSKKPALRAKWRELSRTVEELGWWQRTKNALGLKAAKKV